MQASLVIAAGGSGSRFKKSLKKTSPQKQLPSKLFMPLQGKPLLIHTLESFHESPYVSEILVAAPKNACAEIRSLIKKYGIKKTKVLVGGKTRAESVLNGVRRAQKKSKWILVHDGARPFLSEKTQKKLLAATKSVEGVILAKKVVPTIKRATRGGLIQETVDRSVLYEAETPQLVKRSVLLDAYRKSRGVFEPTDEASLLEFVGAKVKLVTHDDWNPKVTTANDLELAEAYLNKRESKVSFKTGFGTDLHRLVSGRKLMLGGIHVPFDKGPEGHSDGDALLHAITDALLGATGSGDIGEWFSDQNKKFKNISSAKILAKIYQDCIQGKWCIEHVDSVITLEKPKLGKYKLMMRKKIASLLDMNIDNVSVKAKTKEGLGPEGEGLAISCEALVTLIRK